MNRCPILKKAGGLLLTMIISGILVYILFTALIKSPNSYFYSTEGDGIQHYFAFIYHIKYDTSFTQTSAINYPYGELSTYAGNMPAISNTVKALTKLFNNVNDHNVAIFNFSILFSIVFASGVLFLIFFEINISYVPSILFALGITFLSPQFERLGGHQSLAYMCAVPLLLYLLLRWHKKRHILHSIIIAVIAYFFAKIHVYYLAMFMFIIGFYWIFQQIMFENKKFISLNILHLLLQMILPMAILMIEAAILDTVQDRPTRPYGFLIYRAYPQGVLLPIYEPYGNWLRDLINSRYVKWEGVAYVGLVSSIVFFLFVYRIIQRTIRKKFKLAFQLTSHSYINILFWTGLAGLLYSFGLPYILGLEFLADYIGPLRQFRAIGRFAWIFFYLMNITTFYYVFQLLKKQTKLVYWLGISIILLILGYDAWLNVRSVPEKYQTTLPELTEAGNCDVWCTNERSIGEAYQAIIPLPFYQQGPENIGKTSLCSSKRNSFVLSLKTSLPLVAISAGRTSLHQGINNLQLVQEPYHTYEILNELPNNKPFLLVVDTCKKLTNPEQNLLDHAEFIHKTKCCSFYSLPVDTLRNLPMEALKEKISNTKNDKAFTDIAITNDNMIFQTYDHLAEDISYRGPGSKSITFRKNDTIFNDRLNKKDTSFIASFWYYPANKDLYPRMRLDVRLKDEDDETYHKIEDPIFNHIKIFDGSWALVEFKIILKNRNDSVTISLENRLVRNPVVSIDQFMIRPENQDIVQIKYSQIMINNRYYQISEDLNTK